MIKVPTDKISRDLVFQREDQTRRAARQSRGFHVV